MEAIGQTISRLATSADGGRPLSLSRKSGRGLALIRRFGDEEGFLQKANPDMQAAVCRDVGKAFFADYPTLAELNTAFSWNTATQWLVPELLDLSEFCGCKDKLTRKQMEQLADVIAANYGYMKISELMLFFQRFKTGRYGRFYGAVDPMVVTSALRVFDKERGEAYGRHEQEERKAREERERPQCVTWEEYCKMRGIEGRKNPMERRD